MRDYEQVTLDHAKDANTGTKYPTAPQPMEELAAGDSPEARATKKRQILRWIEDGTLEPVSGTRFFQFTRPPSFEEPAETKTPSRAKVPAIQEGKVIYGSGASRSADAQDVRYDLIAPEGLRRLAARYALGARQHGDRNWENGMPGGVVMNHLLRHLTKWMSGQDPDDDHLAAAAWGLFALMEYEATHPECIQESFPTRKNVLQAKTAYLLQRAAAPWAKSTNET